MNSIIMIALRRESDIAQVGLEKGGKDDIIESYRWKDYEHKITSQILFEMGLLDWELANYDMFWMEWEKEKWGMGCAYIFLQKKFDHISQANIELAQIGKEIFHLDEATIKEKFQYE